MKLNEQQINFFKTFGYLKIPAAFASEINTISDHFDKVFESQPDDVVSWVNQAHEYNKRTAIPQFLDRDPYLASLIDDPRIAGPFSSLCGDDFNYLGSDANIFDCGTRWHSDNYGSLSKYLNVKIIFYLEKLDENSGALRVIPGSHNYGDKFSNTLTRYLLDNDSFETALGLNDEEIPSQVINTEPGDIVIFDYRLKHATCYKGNSRRMFAVVASERMAEEDLPDFRKRLKMTADLGYTSYYGKAITENAPPQRLPHLEQLRDIDIVGLKSADSDDQFTKDLKDQGL